MAKRCVWLNMETGEFSNSWDEEVYENTEDLINNDKPHWKLIEYTCLTDENFEFMDKMKLR